MNKFVRRWLSTAMVAGSLVTGLAVTALAQSTPGFTIFGGVRNGDELRYFLDFGGRPFSYDRYRLRIPSSKMDTGVSEFIISYPDYYDGIIDAGAIELVVRGNRVPADAVLDQQAHRIQIVPREAVLAGSPVEIILNNVKNPQYGGTYYFEASANSPGDIPLSFRLGTWIITIGGG
jgi:hypothetical protein